MIENMPLESDILPFDAAGHTAYLTHLKPYVAKLMAAIGLDVTYLWGEGDRLIYLDEDGQKREVLDMIGGFGANLFGHNHPELVACAQAVLSRKRPILVQASTRSYAGLLAERLAEMVAASTGETYIATLANSGAEAVEAAIKHAALARQKRIKDFIEAQQRTLRAIRLGVQTGTVTLPEGFFDQAADRLEVAEISDLNALEFYLIDYNLGQLQDETHYLALEGSFHGKSSGALKLTHSPDFRKPWYDFGLQVDFLPRNDVHALEAMLAEARVICHELLIDHTGSLQLGDSIWSQIVGCFVEPIQGEGGIHEIAPPFMQALREAADQETFPLIIDEIQSGLGRTGAFLAAEHAGVAGDYILLAKALGGGLAKQAVLLVRRDQYIEEFGYLHTSTFAEDDFSAAIGLAALDLVGRDDGALLQACRDKGAYLLTRLRALQQRFPQVIREVRGRGLMVGVELSPQTDSPSNLLRVASEQNLLGFLVCGYLLHGEGIRIAPTLSANNTIRLEPSAYIGEADLDHFCAAFERTMAAIARADSHRLTRHIAGYQPEPERETFEPRVTDSQAINYAACPGRPVTRRVVCIAHFIHPEDLLHWDPTLAPLSATACSRLLEKTNFVLEPFIADERIIEGQWGERVTLSAIGLPRTAAQMMAQIRAGQAQELLEEIEAAVELAKNWGATIIGFAGYSSIVTNNCQALVEHEVGLTSGNSLTAAAALKATRRAARESGIDLTAARLGIVGGVGNIGRVLAEIEAEQVQSLYLLGRPGAERRLHRLAGQLAQSGARPDVHVSTDLTDLRQCNLIISATNAPEPLITSAHLGTHPTVICDVAVPGDAALDLISQRPTVRLIAGGIMQLPNNQDLTIRGMPLATGEAYACISEVILLGLAGIREHFSYGPLRAERVRQIGELAQQHGFQVEIKDKRHDKDTA